MKTLAIAIHCQAKMKSVHCRATSDYMQFDISGKVTGPDGGKANDDEYNPPPLVDQVVNLTFRH